jgi:hypothetical protein
MPAWSPDEDGGSITDPESRRVILKSSIDSNIGLAFWGKPFETLLNALQTIRNITINGRRRFPEIGSNELELDVRYSHVTKIGRCGRVFAFIFAPLFE